MKYIDRLLMLVLLVIGFAGCEKKDPSALNEVHWDRDMCSRCKMVVSERHHGVQVIDVQSGKHYMFDDIGCAVLWFDEKEAGWESNAKIWITDVETGQWIDARTAFYDTMNITPMAYGFAAHATKQGIKAGEEIIDFDEVSKRIREIEEKKNRKVY